MITLSLFAVVPGLYWDKPKAAVLRFKFHGRREYAESFGLSMARSVKENFSSVTFDLVCEIPLTKRRRRERGFDQARLLAKELARGLKLPYVSALEKPKGTESNMSCRLLSDGKM